MAVKITDAFEVEGFVEQRKELDRLLMGNPAMEKKVQGLIRKVLSAVRSNMSKEAQSAMQSDPRKAAKAIRTMVYKRILGGNVNILNKKRASGGGGSYTPTRTLKSGQRGGNRRPRGERTLKLESYFGSDRGFVLRFLNAGTPGNRNLRSFRIDPAREHVHRGSQGGNLQKYGKTINTGYRGHIKARNWFGNRSQHEMESAAENLSQYIDKLIQDELKQ